MSLSLFYRELRYAYLKRNLPVLLKSTRYGAPVYLSKLTREMVKLGESLATSPCQLTPFAVEKE